MLSTDLRFISFFVLGFFILRCLISDPAAGDESLERGAIALCILSVILLLEARLSAHQLFMIFTVV